MKRSRTPAHLFFPRGFFFFFFFFFGGKTGGAPDGGYDDQRRFFYTFGKVKGEVRGLKSEYVCMGNG